MKMITTFSAATILFVSTATAADIESGVAVGGKIGSYKCVKTAGVADGVKNGKSLCYT